MQQAKKDPIKVLVTGAGGQLGQALEEALADQELVALTRQALDITDLAQVRGAVESARPDLVINAAAYTNVDGADSDETAAYLVNEEGPRNLATATAELEIPLVHVSTDYVFDGAKGEAYLEDDPTNPQCVYGASKLAGEEAVRQLNPKHFIVRTAWLYHTVGKNFAKTMCGLADRPEVRVVHDQVGSPTYVPHLAKAMRGFLEGRVYGTYHLAGAGTASWFELTQRLYQEMGFDTSVVPVTTEEFPRPAKRPAFAALATQHEPPILLPSWEEGAADFAAAYKRVLNP